METDPLDELLGHRQEDVIAVSPEFERFFGGMYKVIEAICMVFMLLQVVVVTYVVAGRFLWNRTPRWGEEIALLFMVWLSLLTASLAVKGDLHIRVTLIDNLLGKTGVRIRDAIFSIMCMGFSIYLFIGGFRLARLSARSIMPGSGISTAWLNASMCVAGLALFFMFIYVFGKMVWPRPQRQ